VAKIRYYTDEQVSRAVISGLRQRGVDVLSVPEAGKIGASDREQLAFALAEGRVLLTYDTGRCQERCRIFSFDFVLVSAFSDGWIYPG